MLAVRREKDAEAFTAFINGIETGAGVGGDAAEDVLGGLKVVIEQLSWRSNDAATKVLIHIADAPCHGQMYHDSNVGDSYPDGDLTINPSDLLDCLYKQHIQYYFGYIKKQATEKMIAVFNGILCKYSGESCYIKELDATNPESVEVLVFNSLEESITKTLSFSGHIPKGLVELDPHVPNWDDEVASEKGIITPSVRPTLTENEVILCLPSVLATVKRGTQPFAMGTCRYAYHGYIVDTNTHVVLKENKNDTRFKRYLENYHAHLTAVVYAMQFNREKPDTVEAIHFVSFSLLEIKGNSGWKHFSVEPYIEGEYVKFNNNAGYVAKSSKMNDTLQAFSHYTWQKSGKRFIVCDLQGVVTKSGALLTDPSIHSCTEELLRYGPTNLGAEGIETFFSHHKCSTVCIEMKLQPYS
ncbi:hypothetical protein EMCRGX_G024696 [Ephydatia muelleri]